MNGGLLLEEFALIPLPSWPERRLVFPLGESGDHIPDRAPGLIVEPQRAAIDKPDVAFLAVTTTGVIDVGQVRDARVLPGRGWRLTTALTRKALHRILRHRLAGFFVSGHPPVCGMPDSSLYRDRLTWSTGHSPRTAAPARRSR